MAQNSHIFERGALPMGVQVEKLDSWSGHEDEVLHKGKMVWVLLIYFITGTPMHGYWNKYTTDTYNYNNIRRKLWHYPTIIKNERSKWHKGPNWYKYYTI